LKKIITTATRLSALALSIGSFATYSTEIPHLASLNHQHAEDVACSFEQDMKDFSDLMTKRGHEDPVVKFEQSIQQSIAQNSTGLSKLLRTAQVETSSNGNPRYVIPIVFHVYGGDDDYFGTASDGSTIERIIDEAKVKAGLAEVNANFKSDKSGIDSPFDTIEAGMDIEFRLAQLDPDGNTTNGVIFHQYEEGFALNGSKDADIQKYAWDNSQYMNVYIQVVLKAGSTTNSGTAWLPSQGMTDENTARIVYNGKYLEYSPPASSLTHEVGHYLGLHHTFDNGGCTAGDGDFVDDTPATSGGLGCGEQYNCFGELVNSQNHMDYNSCEAMFTAGQTARMDAALAESSRVTLWQQDNLVQTGVAQPLGPRVLFNYSTREDEDLDKLKYFLESPHLNDGSIINKRTIKAVDGATFSKTGQLTKGLDYNVANLPQGLSLSVNVVDSTTATINVTGNASAHDKADNATFSLTLLDGAVTGSASALYAPAGSFDINFADDYKVIYGNLTKQTYTAWSSVNMLPTKTGYSSLLVGGDVAIDMLNFDGDSVAFNNFINKIEMLTTTGSHNVQRFNEGDVISATSSGDWFVRPDINQYPPVITSPDYTAWHGKVGYAAIRIPTAFNEGFLYGWLKLKVSDDGATVNVLSYGINENANEEISAAIDKPVLEYFGDRFHESSDNDGSIESTLTVQLENASFAKTGSLAQGTDFTVSYLPSGHTVNVDVISASQATITVSGNATRHTWRDSSYSEFSISFLDSAFSTLDVTGKTKKFAIEYIGDSFIKTVDRYQEASVADETSGHVSFLQSYESIDNQLTYQMQNYEPGAGPLAGFKFITWRKDALANENYEVIKLSQGDYIGPNSSWKPGREYWSDKGQHMLDGLSYGESNFADWRGETGYLGVRFRRSGKMHYGWIKLSVSSDGETVTFIEYGLSGKPETGIKAGTIDEADDVTPVVGVGEEVFNNTSKTVSGDRYSETDYFVNVPADSSNLVVTLTGGSGDVDLYVNEATRIDKANRSNWTCVPYKSGNEESCVIDTPSAGIYQIMLYGFSSYNDVNFSISVDNSGDTGGGDNGGGTTPTSTVDDVCLTQAPVANRSDLYPNEAVCLEDGNSALGFYLGNSNDYGNIGIRTDNGTGNLSLFAKNGGWPATDGSDASSENAANQECLVITKAIGEGNTWTYISVLGDKAGAALNIEVDVASDYCN